VSSPTLFPVASALIETEVDVLLRIVVLAGIRFCRSVISPLAMRLLGVVVPVMLGEPEVSVPVKVPPT
jgi:hypothetical protein